MQKDKYRPLLKRVLEWSTCSIALLPAVPYNINSICIIIWTFLSVYYRVSIKHSIEKPPADKRLFFMYGGSYLLLLISLAYSNNLKEGTSNLVTQLPMLLFPLVFFLLPFPLTIEKTFLRRVLNVFLFSTLMVSLWLIYHYWSQGLLNELDKASSFNTIFRDTADRITKKHPTTLSLYLAFSVIIAFHNLTQPARLFVKFLNVISILLFLFLLLVLASRTPVIATFVALLIFSLVQIRRTVIRFAIVLLLLISSFLLVRFTPALYSRVQETLQTDFSAPKGLQHNSTNIRVGIYKCTWQLIKQRPFIGYGVGSQKKVLNDCYAQYPTDVYQINFYNTHNQYANFWLLTGMPGVLLFMISLFYAFYLAIKHKNGLFICFLALFGISFLTDDILTRQAGIVIYYFVLCLFIQHIKSKKLSY